MDLSKQIQLFLTEGKNTGSHKFAFLRAILDYIVEKSPEEDADVKIPLIYFAEKFLNYYWVMYLNKTQQLLNSKLTLKFYKHFEKMIKALKFEPLKHGHLEVKHIHILWGRIKDIDKLDRNIIAAINEARLIVYDGPIVHTKNIYMTDTVKYLDFYQFPDDPPKKLIAQNYSDLYNKENFFIYLNKNYISEFKKLYFWLDIAVITHWAQFTDKLPSNCSVRKPTGLSLLEIPKPDRNNLNIYRKHFKNMGISKCIYCNKNMVNSIDHIIPWRMVKSDNFWNMLPICNKCNSAKSDRIWSLEERSKEILKKSIGVIVDGITEYPEFSNQVKQHFIYSSEKYIENKGELKEYLYNLTLSRISDFRQD